MMTTEKWIAIGAINMAIAVALGALGAHFLKENIKPELLDVFEKAVKYHLIHALALVILPILLKNYDGIGLVLQMQLLGIILFSGSLYLLSTRFLLGIDSWKWLGIITPFGGLLFIASWLLLAVKMYKQS